MLQAQNTTAFNNAIYYHNLANINFFEDKSNEEESVEEEAIVTTLHEVIATMGAASLAPFTVKT